jgi:hypothetical protein
LPAERDRVSDLLDQYNEELTVGPALDQQFREVARERTSRHPLRTYLKIPFLRALTLWFTPRLELLPYSGHLRPVRVEWEDDRPDFLVTLALLVVNFIYLALAVVGAWITRRQPGIFHHLCGNAGAALRAGMFPGGDCAGGTGFCWAGVGAEALELSVFHRLGMDG